MKKPNISLHGNAFSALPRLRGRFLVSKLTVRTPLIRGRSTH